MHAICKCSKSASHKKWYVLVHMQKLHGKTSFQSHIVEQLKSLEEVGHASSNVTNMSHAPTYNVLNIWQVSIAHPCVSRRMPLGKNSVSLNKRTFQSRSTPAKPASSEALLLLIIKSQHFRLLKVSLVCSPSLYLKSG